MSAFPAFVLGLLIGWIVEWIIDWVYWRRRASESRKQEDLLRERLKMAETHNADLEHQIVIQKVNLASLQEKLTGVEAELNAIKARPGSLPKAEGILSNPVTALHPEIQAAQPVPPKAVVRDNLEVIKGIGPVICQKLYQVGINTFADLAALTPEHLRELVGDMISRLANEDAIIEQAKVLAAEKSQGG